MRQPVVSASAMALVIIAGSLSAENSSAETVIVETHIKASPTKVWASVRDVYHADRLTPGSLKSVARDGDDRIMTFTNGSSVRQHIVTIDEKRRRVAFAAISTRLEHHSSSMEVLPEGPGARVIWITDFLPDSAKDGVAQVMTEASASMKRTLEAKP